MRRFLSNSLKNSRSFRRFWMACAVAFIALGALELFARTACTGTLKKHQSISQLTSDGFLARHDPNRPEEQTGSWLEAPTAADWAPTMKGNPFLLWEYAPGQRTESDTDININSLGLRGPEPRIPKPDGVQRLLSTGDSSVYGFKVKDGGVFTDVAADRLGQQVEGWTAAIPGYSTYQSLNMLEMRALKLQPDVLVIANLWSDNNFDTFVDKELLEDYDAFEQGATEAVRGLLGKSALFRTLDYHFRLAKNPTLSARGQRKNARKTGWSVGGQNINSGKRRVDANDYATNLHRLIDVAHNHNAEAIFVLLPHPFDLEEAAQKNPAWTLYRSIMRDVASSRGVPLVDMITAFQNTGLGRQELFFDEGEPGIQDDLHPTELGHRIMGEALAAALQGWSEGQKIEARGSGQSTGPYEDPFVFEEGNPNKVAETGAIGALSVTGNVNIKGFRGSEKKKIHIDALDPTQRPPRVLGTTRLNKPGPFEIQVPPGSAHTTFRVYEDLNGDGPTEDDPNWFFGNNQWDIHTGDENVDLLIEP